MFFPLPPTVNLTPHNLEECKITEVDRNFIHSSEWFDHLLKCANESQILIHNLRVEGIITLYQITYDLTHTHLSQNININFKHYLTNR